MMLRVGEAGGTMPHSRIIFCRRQRAMSKNVIHKPLALRGEESSTVTASRD